MQLQRDFADLVEEEGAAVREFEAADAVAHRAGEGAAHMAEEFALEQFARNGGAIDADERAVGAAGGFVDGAGDQFLAGAALAGDQHRGGGGRDELDLPQRLLDRSRLPDDAARIRLDADFLLQIGVFELQPLAQAVDFGERRMQFLIRLAALADIAEHDHGADHHVAVADRRRCVFDPDRRAVLAPEHLVVDLVDRAVAEGGIDRAVVIVIVAAIGVAVMHDGVDLAADQFIRRPAQHALGGGIDEGRLALRIDAIDPFTGGAQDQLVLTLDVLEHALDALPRGDAAMHVVFRIGIDMAASAFLEIAQRERDQQALADFQQRACIFELQRLAGRMARRQRAGEVAALGEHSLREHDEGRKLPRMQRADLDLAQGHAVIAEQGTGREIAVDNLIAVRIEQQGRLDGVIEGDQAQIGLADRRIHGGLRDFVIGLRNLV